MYIERWLTVCWTEMVDELENIKRSEKDIPSGVLFVQPPFADITLCDGFWANLNDKFGKMFDMAEDEEIDNNNLLEIIDEIKNFVDKKYGTDQKNVIEHLIAIQTQPEKREIRRKIPFRKYKHHTEILCRFLFDAYSRNKDVTVML